MFNLVLLKIMILLVKEEALGGNPSSLNCSDDIAKDNDMFDV